VTSCFSHEGTGHILMNMASLYFMAGPVIGLLGNVGFVTLYLFSVGPIPCDSVLDTD
jgi:rhomboid-like protein